MQDDRRTRWIGGILLAGGIGWMLSRQLHFSGWVDDDAFISFRYARNWATGHGLVFNPGERVEGFTNFLWTALLAVAQLLHLDLPATAQVLGGLVAVCTVLLVASNAHLTLSDAARTRNPVVGSSLVLLPPLALCLSESWSAWSVGGLENVLSGFLVTAAWVAWTRSLSSETHPRRLRLLSSGLLCLAILNHPTNALFAVAIGGHLLLHARARSWKPIEWLPFFALLAGVLGLFLVARVLYYGDLLPNTWYAKGGMSVAVWQRGLRYFGQVFLAYPVAILVTAGILIAALRKKLQNAPVLVLAVSIALSCLYLIAVGGEEFPAYRATVALVPAFCLLLSPALEWIWQRMSRPGAATGVAAVAVLLASTLPLGLNERVRRLDTALAEGRTALSRTAALMLKRQLPPDTLFAHSGAGLIAFYTDFPWIDTLGLCDAHIARTHVDNLGQGAAGHEKGDGRYVWERQPDYVMFPGYPISNRLPGTKSDKELWAIPEFHQRYRPMRVSFTFQAPQDTQPQQISLFLYQKVDAGAR